MFNGIDLYSLKKDDFLDLINYIIFIFKINYGSFNDKELHFIYDILNSEK